MISLRDMRAYVWRGLLCASDQEIRDGMDFYPGAHGLCRMLAAVFNVSVDSVAGIYAALSPMNGWYSNVANVVDVLRYQRKLCLLDPDAIDNPVQVNTSNTNRRKALLIADGHSPLSILGGSKVRSFYRGIANPDDADPIPVDRHLICLAVGRKVTNHQELRSLAGDRQLYDRVEQVYRDLGKREGLGNRLAAIAWFVQRRIRGEQRPIPHPDSPICCGVPMQSHGHAPRRFRCTHCRSTRNADRETQRQKLLRLHAAGLLMDKPANFYDRHGYIRPDAVDLYANGRPLIYLPTGHPYRNTGGWQWLSRFVVMYETGERLRRDEHVHHNNGRVLDCRSDNLSVLLDVKHGRLHARKQLLYMLRDYKGRWATSTVPAYSDCLDDRGDQDDVPF